MQKNHNMPFMYQMLYDSGISVRNTFIFKQNISIKGITFCGVITLEVVVGEAKQAEKQTHMWPQEGYSLGTCKSLWHQVKNYQKTTLSC
jgi:hypothetical protein